MQSGHIGTDLVGNFSSTRFAVWRSGCLLGIYRGERDRLIGVGRIHYNIGNRTVGGVGFKWSYFDVIGYLGDR